MKKYFFLIIAAVFLSGCICHDIVLKYMKYNSVLLTDFTIRK